MTTCLQIVVKFVLLLLQQGFETVCEKQCQMRTKTHSKLLVSGNDFLSIFAFFYQYLAQITNEITPKNIDCQYVCGICPMMAYV
jgi:hypothetical protein